MSLESIVRAPQDDVAPIAKIPIFWYNKYVKTYIQYPKLLLLCCTFILAYVLYQIGLFNALPVYLHGHGYISMFLGGALFSFGFTTPFAIAIFIAMADEVHPGLGALVAGIGAVLSDMCIFEWIRFSFADELHKLRTTAVFRWVGEKLHHESVPERIREYILWTFAGIIIASPLPDEIGVTLLGGMSEIKERTFAFTCFFFNTIGIFLILITTQSLS